MSEAIQIFREPGDLQKHVRSLRAEGKTIAFVPTMGYLHEGHMSLMREARKRADVSVLSIYVNPTQFAPGEDLATYPRDESGDLAKAASCGVDLAFCPSNLYLPLSETTVAVGDLAKPLCGRNRPTHFQGVTTVVSKLFNIVDPHWAIFGEKDFQQLAIIRRMTADLNFDTEVVGMPIVREADGLAMSSRNAYLKPDERAAALCLSQALQLAVAAFDDGCTDPSELVAIASSHIEKQPLASIDYVEALDAATLKPVDRVKRPLVLALAVKFGATRLLDNAVIGRRNEA